MFGITGVGADEITFYTFGTLAFYLMGASVPHPQGLVPEGNETITTLSRLYTDVLGTWASVLFLIGAIAVLGSTMWASIPSWSRMYTNVLALCGVLDRHDPVARLRWIRIFTVAIGLLGVYTMLDVFGVTPG